MRFSKVHGLGNDFVMVNGFREQLPADINGLARKVCDRHLGIGADGLIIIAPPQDPATAEASFLIYNNDGSQAESCGNGLRCAAIFAKKEGLVDKDEFVFETLGGPVQPTIVDEEKGIVRVDMGVPRFLPNQIPAGFNGTRVVSAPMLVSTRMYYVTLVSMGNPHCVIFVDDVESFPVEKVGPLIENHHLFPERTNVEFIQLLEDNQIKMRVWERGCGETLACGTGACAATVAANLNGYIKNQADVQLKYGSLHIEWAENNHVFMTGPACIVFEGELSI
ncbi:MAG: diaminopimelate epimerase [Firmicutes bacterium]|nr:diaminopimelate epimerase [Bacillota bacterium]